MNNTITTTVGIDTVIQSIQTELYDSLVIDWVDSIDAYGRVYKNINADNETTPQWYKGSDEYKDVYYNDSYACNYIFIDDDNHNTEDEVVFTTNVKVVFMVDLSRILPLEQGRADMVAQNKVVELLRENALGRFTVTGITKGLRNVFSGFKTDSIRFSDIHPFHCFSVNISLNYYLTEKCD